jgi:hypothetical protein
MQPVQILAIVLLGALHGYTLAASEEWLAAVIIGVAVPGATIYTAKQLQPRDAARVVAIVVMFQMGQTLLL